MRTMSYSLLTIMKEILEMNWKEKIMILFTTVLEANNNGYRHNEY